MQCKELEGRIAFYAWDELEGDERAAVEKHLEGCAACRFLLERERRLLAAAAAVEPAEPSPALLAGCRNDLSDALDAIPAGESRWRRWMSAVRPPQWFALHPAWSSALLLLIGVAVGSIVPGWFLQQVQPRPTPGDTDLTITGSWPRSRDLRNLAITGINRMPSDSGSPRVELYLAPEQPVVVQGTLDASEVKRALTQVVTNNQRFDSGLRLDSVELLESRIDDPEVRTALCHAARNDRNPGVRLKALEAVRALGQEEEVRQILIDALLHDDNPGVRVEAINALRAFFDQHKASADPRLIELFRDRMQRDPSTYVRLQSAAAMRQLRSGATY